MNLTKAQSGHNLTVYQEKLYFIYFPPTFLHDQRFVKTRLSWCFRKNYRQMHHPLYECMNRTHKSQFSSLWKNLFKTRFSLLKVQTYYKTSSYLLQRMINDLKFQTYNCGGTLTKVHGSICCHHPSGIDHP